MKRAPFLGAAAAVLLSGCGGRHAMQALPGVAPLNPNSHSVPNSGAITLVPAVADPIPASVLAEPVIGEASRFDGTTAPAGWVFAKGQDLSIADNPRLFAVLGHRQGDRATSTFTLPNPGFGYIIAAAGTYMTGPQMIAKAARHAGARQYSLGPNAVVGGPRPLSRKQEALREMRLAALRDAQQFSRSAPRAGYSPATPPPADVQAHIERAQAEGRISALAALSADNRARIEALVASALAGGTTIYRASIEMSRALSSGEARALLGIHDATVASFRPGWGGMDHPDPQLEAARYLLSVVFDREQSRKIATMS